MDFFQFDDDYVRRLREGDRETEQHYFHYFGFHLRMKLRGRVPADDVDDAVQIVHTRVLKSLGEVRDCHKFGAWVFGIADNVIHEQRRKERPTDELTDTFVADFDIVRDLITKETQERVQQTVRLMEADNKRDGAILRALFLNDKDKDEICREWGVERDYLRVLLHRALKKFRELYGDPADSLKRFRTS